MDAPNDGIGRYSSGLAYELAEHPNVDLTLLIYDKRQLSSLPDVPYILTNNPTNLWREFLIARVLKPHNFDIVYSPFFIMGSFHRSYRLILTIHDLIYFTHKTPPQWLPWYVRVAWRLFHVSYVPLCKLLNTADAVATVSETARQELLAHRVTTRPIYTVLNAVSQDFVARASDNHAASNHIVYMGAFTPYKNVECLIEALTELPDIYLDLCSKIPAKRRRELQNFIVDKDVLDRVIIHDGVSDEEYRELLRDARCLATASRLEGFGLPIIEAQQAGVPVVCSDIPIFHEVGQGSVLFFSPDQPEQAAKQIAALADADTSRDLIQRGYENVARYSWKESAAAAAKLCRSVLKTK
mgnify:CR=1 FL=1